MYGSYDRNVIVNDHILRDPCKSASLTNSSAVETAESGGGFPIESDQWPYIFSAPSLYTIIIVCAMAVGGNMFELIVNI